ncbi:hypothetical protein K438DRAFT_966462 [Mycena galopus ATCC 62051]|nr:hypothetical protein K438DRAFT_966462 [Mycena galopus ATCC 62051]
MTRRSVYADDGYAARAESPAGLGSRAMNLADAGALPTSLPRRDLGTRIPSTPRVPRAPPPPQSTPHSAATPPLAPLPQTVAPPVAPATLSPPPPPVSPPSSAPQTLHSQLSLTLSPPPPPPSRTPSTPPASSTSNPSSIGADILSSRASSLARPSSTGGSASSASASISSQLDPVPSSTTAAPGNTVTVSAKSKHTGVIVGTLVPLLLVAAIIAIVVCIRRQRRRRSRRRHAMDAEHRLDPYPISPLTKTETDVRKWGHYSFDTEISAFPHASEMTASAGLAFCITSTVVQGGV